ncbi:MAG: DUF927 domain-containing protein [Limnochordaceae bacterium]|nr:DUF927 domain-containing protein [Limnochordaceae bacterium]
MAGCSQEAVIAALRERKLWPAARKDKRQIVATYDYTDADGRLIFQVVRYEPKGFAQRRPDGRGGWIWDLKGIEPVLYRLPEVRAAVQAGQRVYVVEGEKDANSLRALGLVATTAPMGAGKWRKEYAEALRGAHAVILPDKDEPGRKHAQQVARSLHGVAASVKVLELPGDGKDVSDWLAAGGTREELERLANEAPEWAPPATPEPSTDAAADDAPPGYALRPDGVYEVRMTERGEPRLTRLTHAPLRIAAVGEDPLTGERFLRLAGEHLGEPVEEWVRRADAMNAGRLAELAAGGLPVHTANASKVVQYLAAYEAHNGAALPRILLAQQTGWVTPRTFLAGEAIGPDPAELWAPGAEDRRVIAAYRPSGTLEEALTLAAEVRRHPVARLLDDMAYVGPLMGPLGIRTFGVHVWGPSEGGKSAASFHAAAAWGNPEELARTLWVTGVGAERMAALVNGTVLVLDELQVDPDPERRRTLIYLLSGGKGKTRGARAGGLQAVARWRVPVITNGEQAITSVAGMEGEAARMIELYTRALPDKELAVRVHHTIAHAYGRRGPAFVRGLLEAIDAGRTSWHALRDLHAEIQRQLSGQMPTRYRGHLAAVAGLILADALAQEILFPEELPWEEEGFPAAGRVAEATQTLVAVLQDPGEMRSYAERALDWTVSWAEANRDRIYDPERFTGDEADARSRGWWGWIGAEGVPSEHTPGGREYVRTLYLRPAAWEPALRKEGFDPGRVLRDWREAGWIVPGKAKTCTSAPATVRRSRSGWLRCWWPQRRPAGSRGQGGSRGQEGPERSERRTQSGRGWFLTH